MDHAFSALARRLDSLPNGFPPTDTGIELELLAALYTVDEAGLAAALGLKLERPEDIASRLGLESGEVRSLLKGMARKGLIRAGRVDGALGFGLMPFVVGIYEMQIGRIDSRVAELFEAYYQQAFSTALTLQPALHRVIPVRESVQVGMEIHPFESAAEILRSSQAWGVLDCICRVQKALIGQPCDHPLDVCMVLSDTPGAFAGSSHIRELDFEGALDVLRTSAEAGLVHTLSNSQQGLGYICNCCTCSCGILRGIAELGARDVVARSAFVSTVEEDLCVGCDLCLDWCQFDALIPGQVVMVEEERCAGCGLCAVGCPEGALTLIRREEGEINNPPFTHQEWMLERAAMRGIPLEDLL